MALGECTLTVHQTHEAHRAVDVGGTGVGARTRHANATRKAVPVDRAEGGLDALRIGAHLIAGTAVVVHAAGVREHASAETANLARAAGLVIRAAVLACARLANPGAETLVVVRADRRLAADPGDTVDGRGAVRVGLATRALETAPTVVAAAAAGTAVPICGTRILTHRGFADTAVETVRVGLTRDGLLARPEEAVLVARAVVVRHAAGVDRDAGAVDAELARSTLQVRVAALRAAARGALAADADAPREAAAVGHTELGLADAVDAALARAAVRVHDAGVDRAALVAAPLADAAVQVQKAGGAHGGFAGPRAADLTRRAVGVRAARRHDALAPLAGQALPAVRAHEASGVATHAPLAHAVA